MGSKTTFPSTGFYLEDHLSSYWWTLDLRGLETRLWSLHVRLGHCMRFTGNRRRSCHLPQKNDKRLKTRRSLQNFQLFFLHQDFFGETWFLEGFTVLEYSEMVFGHGYIYMVQLRVSFLSCQSLFVGKAQAVIANAWSKSRGAKKEQTHILFKSF